MSETPFKKLLKGREFIRGRFKRSPDTGSYLIPNSVEPWVVLDFYREARAVGYIVEPHSMPEFGLVGFVAHQERYDNGRTSGPISYELYFVGCPTHGKMLEPDDENVDPSDWETIVHEHAEHKGVSFFNDIKERKLCMICYCRAQEGKSFVRRVVEKDIEAIDKMTDEIADTLIDQ